MKRLKYMHLFCGKSWPLPIIIISGIFGPVFAIIHDSAHPVLWGILPPVILTIGFIIFFRIPDDHDIQARRDASYPLWNPLTPALQDYIRQKEEQTFLSVPAMGAIAAVVAGIAFAISRVPPRNHREPPLSLEQSGIFTLIIGSIVFFGLVWQQHRSRVWYDADSSAVYTTVPIDHFFDVTRHGKHETWIDSYLVFYLPDGRYILKAPQNSGSADSVTIIKYRGMLRWEILTDTQLSELL